MRDTVARNTITTFVRSPYDIPRLSTVSRNALATQDDLGSSDRLTGFCGRASLSPVSRARQRTPEFLGIEASTPDSG